MVRKKIISGILLAFSTAFLFDCAPDEKKLVQKDITALKEAVEQKNADEALYYIARDYSDAAGLTYDRFVDIINNITTQFDDINISIKNLTVRIDSIKDDNTYFASCSLGLRVTARLQEERVLLYGGLVKPTPVRARVRKTDHHYQVYQAEY